GGRKALFSDFGVDLPPGSGESGTTLRDLIEHIVREQVRLFRQRQQDRQFIRALTERQIQDQAAKGKVDSGASEVPPQEVDDEAAVGTALQAFEDGLYFVILDEEQQESLDAQAYPKPDSKITFIRLTMLAGG
ncbi:MAG: hypothetical protein KDB32_10100, partial [Planctomycetes bacterium]|nr:hypothetical protein [Planctomycetota bacterium]